MHYAPIILFIYARPDHTQRTLEALSSNTLAQESDLFIYADGPKDNATEELRERIRQTREVARSRQWCRTVTVIESDTNKGLAASIIAGVTETVNKYGKVIVLEDDIVTGKYFLEYMNEALERYKDEKTVWEITGYRVPVKSMRTDSCFLSKRESCWGWATWADRWKHFKKNPAYYKSLFTKKMIREFNMEGADTGIWKQMEMNLSEKINTWAVFWAATIYLNKGMTLTPCNSLVRNEGFDNTGENCGAASGFDIRDSIDLKVTKYPANLEIDKTEFKKDKKYFVKRGRNSRLVEYFSFIARRTLPRFLLLPLKQFLIKCKVIGM